MKKVIALVFALGLFVAAPAMATEGDILVGLSQYDITALAETDMSQIQGEGYEDGLVTILNANLNLNLATSAAFLSFLGGLVGALL